MLSFFYNKYVNKFKVQINNPLTIQFSLLPLMSFLLKEHVWKLKLV